MYIYNCVSIKIISTQNVTSFSPDVKIKPFVGPNTVVASGSMHPLPDGYVISAWKDT
jgi:hypothetical protein